MKTHNLRHKLISVCVAAAMVLSSYAGLLSYVINTAVSEVRAESTQNGGNSKDFSLVGLPVRNGAPGWSSWGTRYTGTITHGSNNSNTWTIHFSSSDTTMQNEWGSSMGGGGCGKYASSMTGYGDSKWGAHHEPLWKADGTIYYQYATRAWIQDTNTSSYDAGKAYKHWRVRAWTHFASFGDAYDNDAETRVANDRQLSGYATFDMISDDYYGHDGSGNELRRQVWRLTPHGDLKDYVSSSISKSIVYNSAGGVYNLGGLLESALDGMASKVLSGIRGSDEFSGYSRVADVKWHGDTIGPGIIPLVYANGTGIDHYTFTYDLYEYDYLQVGFWTATAWKWAGAYVNFSKIVDANGNIPEGYINDNVYRGFAQSASPIHIGIYSDAACTQPVSTLAGTSLGKIEVQRNGNTTNDFFLLYNNDDRTSATYYIREYDDGRDTNFEMMTFDKSWGTLTVNSDVTNCYKLTFSASSGSGGATGKVTVENNCLLADPHITVQKHWRGGKQPVEGAVMLVRRYDMYDVTTTAIANDLVNLQTLDIASAKKIGTHNAAIQDGGSNTYTGVTRISYYTDSALAATNVLFPNSVSAFQTVMTSRYNSAASLVNNKSGQILVHTAEDNTQVAPRQVNSWLIKTDADGILSLGDTASDAALPGSDPLPVIGDQVCWPAGVYVISEVQGTDAYYLNPATTIIYVLHTDGTVNRINDGSVYYDGMTGQPNDQYKSFENAATPNNPDMADEDMPKLGAFTLEKNNSDILNPADRDEADENGNDADIDVDANNGEVIVRGQLYSTWQLTPDFRYYSDGVTNQAEPDLLITGFGATCSEEDPRLVFPADFNAGSVEKGNKIENGELYAVRYQDPDTGNYRYEFRTADLALTPGHYIFVETWVADGFINNYPDIKSGFHFDVYPGMRSDLMNYKGGTEPNVVETFDADNYGYDTPHGTPDADNPMFNKPIPGTVTVQKVDREFDIYDGRVDGLADKVPQGDSHLFAQFTVYNMSTNAVVITETSSATFTDRVANNGGIVGYIYTDATGYGNVIYRIPGSSEAPVVSRDAVTGEWTLDPRAVAVNLPYGTYAIEETVQPVGYTTVDSEEFNAVHGRTAAPTNRQWIVVRTEGAPANDLTYNIVTNADADYTPARNLVIRGGIEVQKSDWDVLLNDYVLEPEGNGAWTDIGFTLYNESPNPVWVDLNGNGVIETREIFDTNAAIVSSDNKYTTKPEYTFTLDVNGHFQSPSTWLPYGSYRIAEMTDESSATRTGYHMLNSEADGGVRHFTIRENNTIEAANKFIYEYTGDDYVYADDHTFANAVKRGGIMISKYNKDDKTQVAQGDASLANAEFAIWNTSDHYVIVDQNGDGILSDKERKYPILPCTEQQINEAIANGIASRTNATGALEWYGKDNAGNDIITACVIKTNATGVAQTSGIALPFGDYIVREVKSSEGYHIDTNFNMHVILTDEVTTATELQVTSDGRSEYAIPVDTYATIDRNANVCTRDGRLVDMTSIGSTYTANAVEHPDGRYDAETNEYRSSVYEAVIRGSFVLQKVDEDDYEAYKNGETLYKTSEGKYVIEPQGDTTFANAKFQVINRSKEKIYTLTYDAAGNEVLTGYLPGEVVWTFTTDGNGYYEAPDDLLPYGTYEIQEVSPSQGYILTTQKDMTFTIGRNANGTAETITRNEEIDRSNTENDLVFTLPGYEITRINGATYEIKNTATGKLVTNANFTISNGSSDVVYEFINTTAGVSDVQAFQPGEQIFAVKTDANGRFVMRQLTAHIEGTDYRTGTKYTFAGDVNGTCTVTLGDYNAKFIANLTTNTVYDKYPIEEPVIRGGLNVLKVDEDKYTDATEMYSPSGDATLGGATFAIYNISDRYVWVQDEKGNWRRTFAATTDGKWISQDDVEADAVYDPDEKATRVGQTKINGVTSTGMVNSANKVTSDNGAYTQNISAFNGATSEDVINKYHTNDVARLGNNELWDLLNNQTPVMQITTDDLGFATTGERDLPYGTYVILEVESSRGYMLPRCWYRIVEIREDGHMYAWDETNTALTPNVDTQVTMEPVIRGDVQIVKQDGQLGAPHSQAANGLEGIEFKIYNVSDNAIYLWELTGYRNEPLVDTVNATYNTPTKIINSTLFNPTSSRGWTNMDSEPSNYVATIVTHWNESMQAYTAETYVINADGSKKDVAADGTTIRGALPYGTYIIRESKTNTVYEFTDGKAWIFQIREEGQVQQCGLQSGDTIGISDAHPIIFVNQIERNDVWFNKIGDGDSVRMDTMWVIKNEDTGERHVIVTNSGSDDDNTGNGTYESAADVNKHTYETNANDKFLAYIDANGLLDTDTQVVTEKDAKENGNTDGKPVAITMGSVNKHVVGHEEVAAGSKDPVFVVDSDDGLNNNGMGYAVYDAGTWFGFCEYTSYKAGTSPSQFVINGQATEEVIVIDETTGKPIILHWADPDDNVGAFPYGHYTISEVRTDTNMGYGLQSYSFTINNSNTDRTKWASELDSHDREVDLGTITDDKAPEYFVETTLIDTKTNSHIAEAATSTKLTETVTYSTTGTTDFGKKFHVEADLYIAQKGDNGEWTISGDPIAHAKGNDFTLNGFFGQQTVTFDIDASALAGKTVVAYAYLYKGDSTNAVASHKDAGDALEQVRFPEITTEFNAALTGNKIVPMGSNVTLVDTVHATNLAPDTRYAVSGQLMTVDKDGNAVAVKGADGKAIIATSAYEFVTEESYDFELVFTGVNTEGYEGKYFVAYAQLLVNDQVVAKHNDITDKNETVVVPRIETDAVDGVSGDQQGVYAKTANIKDTITFENLAVGDTYTAQGTLYERLEDGSVIPVMVTGADGSTAVVTGLVEFVPTESNGQVTVIFDFDSTEYAGKDIVVFETIYMGSVKAEGVTSVADLVAIANHSDASDERQIVHYPEIRTNAADMTTKTQSALAVTDAGIVDLITYKNLIVGKAYVFEGTLMTKDENGNAIPVTGKDGKPVTLRSEEFVPTEKNGTYEMTFKFDASNYAGKDIVVFEKLLSATNTDIVYVSHEDINDENQTVHFPKIRTVAHDATTGDEVGYATESTVFVDTVLYENLVPGLTYRVVGTINDKETGLPIKESGAVPSTTPAAGSDDTDVALDPAASTTNNDGFITAETTFVAPAKDGSIDVTFTFDARAFKNRDVVAFETLYLVVDTDKTIITEDTVNTTEYKMAEHADINDENQTVHYPDVYTEALEKNFKLHESFAGESVTIDDNVHCQNLVIGKEYTIRGTLVDKKTGEGIIDADGKAVSAELTFTAEEKNCEKVLSFTFNGSALRGHTVVAFETLYHNDKVVAVHADLSDEAQTVYFPDIKTIATSIINGGKLIEPIEVETIRDEVKYSNLIIGHTYRIDGALMLIGEDGTVTALTDADGKAITGSVTFTAEVTDGSVYVDFGKMKVEDLLGKNIVVFEDLYNVDLDEPVHLVEHHDVNDNDQTVRVTNPQVATVLAETETGSKCIAAEQTAHITDTIQYTDLVPGNNYVIVSTLVDQVTGETLKDDKGNDLKVEAEVTPENATASVTVNFTFEGKNLEGKVVVAFNELYRVIEGERYLVVAEKDLENKDQTVTFPKIDTTAEDATTGDKTLAYSKTAVIRDRVDYFGLETGKIYTVTGTPYDKETGKPVEGVAPVTVTFTASAANGSVIVEVPIDTTALAGKKIVMFEDLAYEGKTICVHHDINDDNQTVTVCSIATVLTGADGAKTVKPTKVTITDTVKFTGLTPGQTYILSGEIVDKGTGKAVTGTTATATTPAPSESTNGSENESEPDAETIVYVSNSGIYHLKEDCSGLTNYTAMPLNEAIARGYRACQDCAASTEATPEATATPTPTEAPTTTSTVTPTPVPTNVAGNIEYKVVAKNTIEFTPTEANGSVQITFQVDATEYNGHSLVAFETVTTKSGVLVAEHKDINDKDQTIVVTDKTTVRTGVTMFAIVFATAAAIAVAIYGVYVGIVLKRRKKLSSGESDEG